MGIKHLFTSGILDAGDATKVRPSNWNANHTIDGDVNFGGFDILNCGNFTPSSFTAPYLNVKDYGAVGDGATNDYAAIQACLDDAFGPVSSPHGEANKVLNRAVYFPAGTYEVVPNLDGKAWESPHLFGDGKSLSNIHGPSGGAAIVLNGCARGLFENMTFSGGGGPGGVNSGVIFGLNWDNTGGVPLTGNTFNNCAFVGPSSGIGCAVGQGTFMGSENLWLNCTFANLDVGLRCYNQNALDNSIIGGDAFSCNIAACTPHLGEVDTIIGWSTSGNGYDFLMGGVPGSVVLMGIRSESQNFFGASNTNGGISLIGVEHTGTGYFIGPPGGSAPIVVIGCATAGITYRSRGHWIASSTYTPDATPGIMNVSSFGEKPIVRANDISPVDSQNYINGVIHNKDRGFLGTCVVPDSQGFTQTFVIVDATGIQIETSDIITPTGLVVNGGSGVHTTSTTIGSSITITCLRQTLAGGELHAVIAMTGSWSFTPF